jgi:hypothetical protein
MSNGQQADRERGHDARDGARHAAREVGAVGVQGRKRLLGCEIDRAVQPS